MKRIVTALMLVCIALTTFCQEKKVAIAETVDKEDKISYPIEVMVRSNLTKAITNKYGYAAYDRTDIASITGEQNFQRTGMVSDASIKKLGEMTGADYILIAEAVMFDEANIFVTAKVLNVETAQTDMVDNELMGTSASDIQEGCTTLANKLLGVCEVGSNNNQNGLINNNIQTNKQNATPYVIWGYLKVFPNDIGTFEAPPYNVVAQINKKTEYGYNTWRIPTKEELNLMKSNNIISGDGYMSSDGSSSGIVRLVTDKATASEIAIEEAAAKKVKEEKAAAERAAAERAAVEKEKSDKIAAKNSLIAAAKRENGYVDLGLPSGTYWKGNNENGYYSIETAKRNFGNKLPKKYQLDELENNCSWEWIDDGFLVVGPNGNAIFIPQGCYWASTESFGEEDILCVLYKSFMITTEFLKNRARSVRLVKK